VLTLFSSSDIITLNTIQEENMTQETTTESPNSVASLTLTDLNALKQIIEVTNSRGAFKPDELLAVGAVYQKLSLFLQQAMADATAEQPAEKVTQLEE
jgi:hypothetical protein